jgi:hypothetical protein
LPSRRVLLSILYALLTSEHTGSSDVSLDGSGLGRSNLSSLCRYVLVGGACCGASWYLYRLAMGSQGALLPTVFDGPSHLYETLYDIVVWTKNNPAPYLAIEQNQGTKLYEVNHKFEKRCVPLPATDALNHSCSAGNGTSCRRPCRLLLLQASKKHLLRISHIDGPVI